MASSGWSLRRSTPKSVERYASVRDGYRAEGDAIARARMTKRMTTQPRRAQRLAPARGVFGPVYGSTLGVGTSLADPRGGHKVHAATATPIPSAPPKKTSLG